jgi:carboxylesterase
MQRESLLFAGAYKKHFLAGETKPRPIGEPYLLHSAATQRGVLLIHGLMAAPEEVREWAESLYSLGFTVYAPRLAGHGTSAVDLARCSYRDWVDSVNRGHAILKSCCEQIVVAGFSTGAALALHQAITKPEAFAAVISISAPFKFKGISSRFAEPLDHWNSFLHSLGIKCLRRDFVANHPDNPQINYFRCPVRSFVQVKALMKKVYKKLPALSLPVLIIQADNDPKVDGQSGRKIHDRISSPNKVYREIHFHQHGIVRGEISRNVFAEVEAFLNKLALI